MLYIFFLLLLLILRFLFFITCYDIISRLSAVSVQNADLLSAIVVDNRVTIPLTTTIIINDLLSLLKLYYLTSIRP